MKPSNIVALIFGVIALLIPSAYADEWNKKTIFTFNGPVEIPGQVLPAGTYVFKLADSQADRNIVQVFNKNEDHLYGTFLAIPDYRMRPTGKPVIMFEERKAGSPEAVKAWFYPGDLYGNQFVYPKARATELARNSRHSVPSMPEEMASNTTTQPKNMQDSSVNQMKQSQLKASRPSGEEVAVIEEFQTQPSNQSNAAANNSNASSSNQSNNSGTTQIAQNNRPARHLPKTGSSLPLVGLVGLLTLGAGASLLTLSSDNR